MLNSKGPRIFGELLGTVLKTIFGVLAALLTSVIIQEIFIYPAFSAGESHCTSLGSPGPKKLSFCVDEEEQTAIEKEIADCGGDVHRFVAQMEIHAKAAKLAYSDALKNMDPTVRAAVAFACRGFEHKDLMLRTSCYRDALDAMEEDAEKVQQMYFSSDPSDAVAAENLLNELRTPDVLGNSHFMGTIIAEQCGITHPENDCFDYNVSALYHQLIDAYNQMSASADSMAQWSVLSARCGEKLGTEVCNSTRPFGVGDFVPANADEIRYAPRYALPGLHGVFNSPVRVQKKEPRVYGTEEKTRTKSKKTKKAKNLSKKQEEMNAGNSGTPGKKAPPKKKTKAKVVAPKVTSPKATTPKKPANGVKGTPTVKPTAAPIAPTAAPIAPTAAPIAPTAAPIAPTAAPIAPTAAPIAPTAAPIAPTAAPIAPTAAPIAPTAAPIAPTAAPVAPTAAPIAPTAAPIAPTAAPVAPTPNVGGTALGTEPGKQGIGLGMGDMANEPKLDCSESGIEKYRDETRLDPRMGIVFQARILAAQEKLYACDVRTLYSDVPQAVFLARQGMRLVRIAESLTKFTTLCGVVSQELTGMASDLEKLQSVAPSTELTAFAQDLLDIKSKGCDGVNVLIDDNNPEGLALQRKYQRDFCAFKRSIEQTKPGATSGISGYLLPRGGCR
ncbi:hypothetical protein WDW37_05695 [Bdellovibrionota bacterium FG-1]